tara:strand:+ start:286 stop:720 length:435 start_codon:yes stop_codon:yes gene_type:complete
MLSKNIIFATLITAFVIFLYIKTVEAEPFDIIHDTTGTEITLSSELLDRDMAIMVLGGIDYYVQECTSLTSRGTIYRNKIITSHNLNEILLPINPTYIKGAISVTGYDCHEMYDLIQSLEQGVVEEPAQPVDKKSNISEDLLTS